jgi:hypothetical protein
MRDGEAGEKSDSGKGRQIIFELPLTESYLNEIEKIPAEKVSSDLHIAETNF